MPDFPTDFTVPRALDPVPLPVFEPADLTALAQEVAMDINDLETVLQHHSLSVEQWERLKALPAFRRLLDSAKQAWNSAINAPERIKIEAAATFEQLMPELAARLMDQKESLDHVVRGAKLLADVAGVSTPPSGAEGGKISINIDLGGGDKLTVTHSAPLNSVTAEPPKAALPAPAIDTP